MSRGWVSRQTSSGKELQRYRERTCHWMARTIKVDRQVRVDILNTLQNLAKASKLRPRLQLLLWSAEGEVIKRIRLHWVVIWTNFIEPKGYCLLCHILRSMRVTLTGFEVPKSRIRFSSATYSMSVFITTHKCSSCNQHQSSHRTHFCGDLLLSSVEAKASNSSTQPLKTERKA